MKSNWALFWTGLFLVGAFGPVAFASIPDSGCFDFSSKVDQALPAAKELFNDANSNQHLGVRGGGVVWAEAHDLAQKPFSEVLSKLMDHDFTKSPEVAEWSADKLYHPDYLLLESVRFLVKPFPGIKIRWIEQWGYVLRAGSVASPDDVLISYQKSEGTSHIQHLCGHAWIKKISENVTAVYLYEESKADQHSQQDALNGLLGTIAGLKR